MLDDTRAYDDWHRRLEVDASADSPWHLLVRKHLHPARDLAAKRVLEIGCGRGGLACWLASHPKGPLELFASDFSVSALLKARDHARAIGLDRIQWELGDIQSLPHREASFDTIISCETIEHVPSPRRALAELGRVLKPGGRLFLTTPNYLGPMGLYRAYLRLRGRRFTEEGQPINHSLWLPRTVRWVEAAGLRVCSVDAAGHYLPWPGRPPIRMDRSGSRLALFRWFALHSCVVAEKR